jgi:hypothetical protein
MFKVWHCLATILVVSISSASRVEQKSFISMTQVRSDTSTIGTQIASEKPSFVEKPRYYDANDKPIELSEIHQRLVLKRQNRRPIRSDKGLVQ